MNALEKYPLPPEENARLQKVILLSAAIWLVAGTALGIIATCIRTDGFLAGGRPMAWVDDIAAMLFPHWTMVVLPLVALALVEGIQAWQMPRSDSFRATTYKIRQGITGEMPRMPLLPMFFLMMLTGFSEELVFRYGLIGLFTVLLAFILPDGAAIAISVLLSTVIFAAVHTQYKGAWHLVVVFVLGLAMGAVFVLTGSLLSVAFAHGIYDFGILVAERANMAREADYFDGKVPTSALDEM